MHPDLKRSGWAGVIYLSWKLSVRLYECKKMCVMTEACTNSEVRLDAIVHLFSSIVTRNTKHRIQNIHYIGFLGDCKRNVRDKA